MRVTSHEILNDPIGPTLRRMTIPMILGIFSMLLFGAVDTYFISLLGTEELAAISFTFPVTFTVMNLSIGLGIATSVILAQVIGRQQMSEAKRVCSDCLLFAILVVVFVASIGLFTIDPLFKLLGASNDTLQIIREYMEIWYLSIGLLVIPMTGNAAIRATGDTKWPSILMISSGLINAILDPLLIFGLGPFPELGVRGAAWATAISWGAGFVVALWLLGVREKLLTFKLPSKSELVNTWNKMVRIGSPISLANMLTPISIMFMTALVARHGEAAVAGYGAGARIESFLMIVAFALTSTLSPFMAQNIGAGHIQRVEQSLSIAGKFLVKFQLAGYLLLALSAPLLSKIFSSDPEVLRYSNLYLWIMPAGACMYGLTIVYNTSFNAAHQSNLTLLVSGMRLFLFILPCAVVGGFLFGYPGILIGSVLGNVLTVLYGQYWVRRVFAGLRSEQAS